MEIGKGPVIYLETVGSTNDYLLESINSGCIEQDGTVVIAYHQVAGKGRDNNTWESEAGKNLTFSVLMKPDFILASQQFQLTKIVTLAICDFLLALLPNEQIKIKWPNDVYIGNKKIAGILINIGAQAGDILYAVAGIGININQRTFSGDIPNPVSLWQLLHCNLPLNSSLKDVMACLNRRYKQLSNRLNDKIDSEYLEALYRFNDFYPFVYKKNTISAKITGVTEYGQLQLITKDGAEITCDMNEIAFIV